MDYDDNASESSVPNKRKANSKAKANLKRKVGNDPTLDEEAAFLKKVTQAEAEENASDTESSDSD